VSPRQGRIKLAVLSDDLTRPEVRGLARYTAGLVRALGESEAVDLVLCARSPLASAYDDLPGERCIWPGRREILWEQWDLPQLVKRKRIDVLHAPSNRGLPAFGGCPTVLTRHDAIERLFPLDFPGSPRSRFRMYYSDEISVRRASRIATVSETSRRDILSVWSLREERVVVAGEGIPDRFFENISDRAVSNVQNKYGLRAPFLLYLGGLDPRKDGTILVEAYAGWRRRDVGCVIAGSTRGHLCHLRETIAKQGLEDSVLILGQVDDEDVPALYRAAACFVYPSRYEGFGLQAVEAMALGVPLIVSDGGALPEVAGDAALIFSAGDQHGLRDCLDRMFADGALRETLVERGKIRAERFRWHRVVPRYISLYRDLLSGGASGPPARCG